MKSWLILLAGLLIWAAHFFLCYAIGEFGGSGAGARIAVVAATVVAAGLTGVAAWRIAADRPIDEFTSWRRILALSGLAIATLAILWQGLPALIV